VRMVSRRRALKEQLRHRDIGRPRVLETNVSKTPDVELCTQLSQIMILECVKSVQPDGCLSFFSEEHCALIAQSLCSCRFRLSSIYLEKRPFSSQTTRLKAIWSIVP